MRLDWILNPLAIYGALSIGMFLCLALFYSFKRDVHRVRTVSSAAQQALIVQLHDMESSMAGMREKLDEIGMRPATPASGMNLNRRVQVLRMHGRGEALETISAALNAPRNEIELLIRVQKMIESNPR